MDANVTLTRRHVLQGASAAALITAARAGAGETAPAPGDTAPKAPLPNAQLLTKRIPGSGEALPVVGIGANGFGRADPAELARVLQRFAAAGGRMIDTAADYGESEAVIGRLLADSSYGRSLFIASKFRASNEMPPPPPGAPPGPPPGAPPGGFQMGPPLAPADSLRRTLERLGRSQLDLIYVHNVAGTEAVMPVLNEWKRAGRVRYLGVSTSNDEQHAQVTALLAKYPLDFVQVNYGLGGRSAETSVLPAAAARGTAVIANVPLGGRGGRDLAAVRERPLPDFAAEIGARSWAQLMLKYVISHPAVTCVISGMTRLAHLEDNLVAGMGDLPDAALRQRIAGYWDRLGA